jgi:hypothetical protein
MTMPGATKWVRLVLRGYVGVVAYDYGMTSPADSGLMESAMDLPKF